MPKHVTTEKMTHCSDCELEISESAMMEKRECPRCGGKWFLATTQADEDGYSVIRGHVFP